MLKISYKVMNIITTIYTILCFYFGGFLIQAYTAYVVYQNFGFFLGIISFFAPIISQIIMFVLYLIFYGLFNEYCIVVLIYLLLIGLSYILSYITCCLEDKLQTNSKSLTLEEKYIKLSKIVMQGLGTSDIHEALEKTNIFYKEQGIDIDKMQLENSNPYYKLANITMEALGTNDIDDAIYKAKTFYIEQGIEIK